MDKTDTTPDHYPDDIGSGGFVHVFLESEPETATEPEPEELADADAEEEWSLTI